MQVTAHVHADLRHAPRLRIGTSINNDSCHVHADATCRYPPPPPPPPSPPPSFCVLRSVTRFGVRPGRRRLRRITRCINHSQSSRLYMKRYLGYMFTPPAPPPSPASSPPPVTFHSSFHPGPPSPIPPTLLALFPGSSEHSCNIHLCYHDSWSSASPLSLPIAECSVASCRVVLHLCLCLARHLAVDRTLHVDALFFVCFLPLSPLAHRHPSSILAHNVNVIAVYIILCRVCLLATSGDIAPVNWERRPRTALARSCMRASSVE